MDRATQSEHRQKSVAQACFTLGITFPRLSQGLDWLITKDGYDPKLPRKIRALDLPQDLLHPYQCIPHEPSRNQRKQILVDLQQVRTLNDALRNTLSCESGEASQPNVQRMAQLFDQLFKIEQEDFIENEKWHSDEAKTDFEARRTELQDSTIDAARQCKNQLDKFVNTLRSGRRKLFELGQILANVHTETQAESMETGRESETLLKWIADVQNAVADAADSYPQLSVFRFCTWSSSPGSVDDNISTLIEQLGLALREESSEERDGGHRRHRFPRASEAPEPKDADDWEQLAKQPIELFGTELQFTHQQGLVLVRLLFSPGEWLTAGDIAVVDSSWNRVQNKRQEISSVITKMETELAKQLNVNYQNGKQNSTERPVQRRTGQEKRAQYRVDLNTIERLINQRR